MLLGHRPGEGPGAGGHQEHQSWPGGADGAARHLHQQPRGESSGPARGRGFGTIQHFEEKA